MNGPSAARTTGAARSLATVMALSSCLGLGLALGAQFEFDFARGAALVPSAVSAAELRQAATPATRTGPAARGRPTLAAGPTDGAAPARGKGPTSGAAPASAEGSPAVPSPVTGAGQIPSPTLDGAERTDGTIVGRVTNGTDGFERVERALVRVVPLFEAAGTQPVTVTVGPTGTFSARGLPVGPEAEYGLVTTYAGVNYIYPALVLLAPDKPRSDHIAVTVYEPDPEAEISARRGHVIVMPAEDRGVVEVTEVWVLRNESDRTRIPTGNTPVVRFALPAGAESVDVADPQMRSRARLEGHELLDFEPVPPGERQAVLSYDLPYSGGALELDIAVPLPTQELRLMVLSAEAVIESADLTSLESAQIGDREVIGAVGHDLPSGAQVHASIQGLPLASVGPRVVQPSTLAPLDQRRLGLVGLAIVVLGVLTALVYPRLGTAAISERRAARAALERARVIEEIAQLDVSHRAGTVGEAAYHATRADLIRRALALSDEPPDDIPSR